MKIINFAACPLVHTSTDFRLSSREEFLLHEMSGFEDLHNKEYGTVNVSKNSALLESYGMDRVKNFMVNFTKDFVKNILKIKQEFYLTQSWATKNAKGARHHEHIHPNTLLSCVYYVQADSGELTISTDRNGLFPNFDFNFELEEFNNFNSKSWTFQVKTGDMVLFPGHLNHSSTPNESNNDRIAIGANFFTRGIFGSYENTDLIEIR
jgi:uncharacterized protein (TIGR02466 family)